MDIEKIREVTQSVAEEAIREYNAVSYASISDTISRAVAAAFDEYEKQKQSQ